MKVAVKLAANADPTMHQLVSAAVTGIAMLMRLHSISMLVAVPLQVGPRSVLNKSYECGIMAEAPASVAATRSEAANALIMYMSLFGIVSIEATMTAEEQAAMSGTWGAGTAVKAGTAAAPTAEPVEIDICHQGQ